ncbi:hypothetical protein AB6E88_05325 [Providencia hangzhouensis]
MTNKRIFFIKLLAVESVDAIVFWVTAIVAKADAPYKISTAAIHIHFELSLVEIT